MVVGGKGCCLSVTAFSASHDQRFQLLISQALWLSPFNVELKKIKKERKPKKKKRKKKEQNNEENKRGRRVLL